MSTSNIEKFDEVTGTVFAILYGRFPLQKPLMIADIVGDENVTREFQPGFFTPTDECMFAYSSINWLIESGYITAKPRSYESFTDAVLTAKGLETLKAIPDSLQPALGKQLNEAMLSGSKSVLRSIGSQALSVGVNIALKAAGVPLP